MKHSLIWVFVMLVAACSSPTSENSDPEKIPVYAWTGGPGKATDAEIMERFEGYKKHGIDVLMYSGGQDPAVYSRVGKIAKEAGLGFHTWIPTMIQSNKPGIDTAWYALNGLGESAYDKPAYADYYKFLCPSKPGTFNWLDSMYANIADVPEVDAIHLDYIRFPDVILARGLWEKYGLVMDREYPQYDYCYCDDCTDGFMEDTGIDIKSVEDPSTVGEWKQYRYDLITNIVSKLAYSIRSKGKEVNAAVFPGPHSVAKKIVRQEWDKWELDAFFPMNYNDFYLEDTQWIGEVTKEATSSVDKPMFSGLFICPKPELKNEEFDPENLGLIPSELGEAIKLSIENGAAGVCLFTPERMTDEHWEVFQKAIYPTSE